MTDIGTLAWARRTNGRLSFPDKMVFAKQGVRAFAAAQIRAGRMFPKLEYDEIDLRAPDSMAAKHAVTVSESLCEPFLLNHCLRTYCWGRLLAKAQGIRHDIELLFVGSVLHDLGLTAANFTGRNDEACFSVTSAGCARNAMQAVEWGTEQLDALEEAIILHLNFVVPIENGPEAHLLHAGAGMDMIGSRLKEIAAPGIDAVLKHYPRLDYKAKFLKLLSQQCSARPDSRVAYFMSYGFGQMIEDAPFAS